MGASNVTPWQFLTGYRSDLTTFRPKLKIPKIELPQFWPKFQTRSSKTAQNDLQVKIWLPFQPPLFEKFKVSKNVKNLKKLQKLTCPGAKFSKTQYPLADFSQDFDQTFKMTSQKWPKISIFQIRNFMIFLSFSKTSFSEKSDALSAKNFDLKKTQKCHFSQKCRFSNFRQKCHFVQNPKVEVKWVSGWPRFFLQILKNDPLSESLEDFEKPWTTFSDQFCKNRLFSADHAKKTCLSQNPDGPSTAD